jgi:hypothetical protein
VQLSQPVLLSLIEQISCDLSRNDLENKLNWIQKASMNIHPLDDTISSYSQNVFEIVLKNLGKEFYNLQEEEEFELLEKVKSLMYIINSIYKENIQ